LSVIRGAGKVSREKFSKYFAVLSRDIVDNEYFDRMIRQMWNIGGYTASDGERDSFADGWGAGGRSERADKRGASARRGGGGGGGWGASPQRPARRGAADDVDEFEITSQRSGRSGDRKTGASPWRNRPF
jgi:hypothetical protein